MQASQSILFPNGVGTDLYWHYHFGELLTTQNPKNTFILTDKNVHKHYAHLWKEYNCIVLENAENSKSFTAIENVVNQLLEYGADRNATLIGIGGGALTDIAGFVAGIYKRGIKCILAPTTILAMVDAAIGGKNGVNIGNYKNMAGLILQPEAIWYDWDFLQTLPKEEWINGFAEIIKHAAIKDKNLFATLQQNSLSFYKNNKADLSKLIQQNINIKSTVVISDATEKNERKLLNFGHTLGHAIEHLYQLQHGQAIAIGMAFAARLSEKTNGFKQTNNLIQLLEQYHLPVQLDYDKGKIANYMFADKKAIDNDIHFILLNEIGNATIVPIRKSDLIQYL